MLKFLAIAAAVAALTGCGIAPKVSVNAKFDEDQAKAMLAPGNNQIHGSALMRQMGGGVVTCAGEEVTLIPATPYAIAWAREVFGNQDGGYRQGQQPTFESGGEAFRLHQKVTYCDAQGAFKFNDVADGRFFLATSVTWHAPSSFGPLPQGGFMARPYDIRGGKTHTVVVSPPK